MTVGLSTALLAIASLTAVVPLALLGVRAPRSIRDLEKTLVSIVVITAVGAVVARVMFGLDLFGVFHMAYLFGVVTVPVLLIGWGLAARARQELRRIDALGAGLGAVIALAGLYGTHVEPNWLRVDHVVVKADVDGVVRIGVVADLQTPNVGDFEHEAIERILAERPNMVVVPGDLFQGSADEITAEYDAFVALLAELVANTELVAVTTGDSDHSIPLQPMVEAAGALFIADTIREVTVAGVPIRLAGIRVVANNEARGRVLAALATPTDSLSLLVAHRPDAVYDVPDNADIDLVISGHTHGGQIAIPLFGPPVTFSDVDRSVAAGGLGIVDGIPLYVSSGVGLERHQAPQVRFGVRPEVAIIDVYPGG